MVTYFGEMEVVLQVGVIVLLLFLVTRLLFIFSNKFIVFYRYLHTICGHVAVITANIRVGSCVL